METGKFIKSLLTLNGMTITKLTPLLSEKMNEEYTRSGLTTKLGRNKITLAEAYAIADILGYRIEFIRN
jgi:hypothetical protein